MHKALGGGIRGCAAAAAVAPRGANSGDGDEGAFGVFQNVHINPFPVRAAIDIGTGGMASMTVGRVDAAHAAVREFMYQTQLPLHLESVATGSSSYCPSSNDNNGNNTSFVLSEKTRNDIRNKMRLLHGALRRDHYAGLSERAAVISWPLCNAADILSLAEELTREFKVDVRVLGKTFQVDMSFLESEVLKGDISCSVGKIGLQASGIVSNCSRKIKNDDDLGLLMQRLVHRRDERKRGKDAKYNTRDLESKGGEVCTLSPKRQMQQLAFLAHAAVSKCVVPHRMLVLTEDSHRGLCILGADTTEVEDAHDTKSAGLVKTTQQWAETGGVLIHALPVDTNLAHRLLVTTVQRRAATHALGGERHSPNPVLREEFQQLRSMLEVMLRPTLPEWVLHKSHAGGVICGSSFNGGALNIAARVAQRTSVSLDHLETHAEMHYCGLTDVLLGVNYPDPVTVLPNAAIASALMRAIETQRFEYLPDVSISAALLIQPSFWTYGRREQVRAASKRQLFFRGGSKQRTFCRPHARENPTAVPEASRQHNQSWNPLSYENSTKGT